MKMLFAAMTALAFLFPAVSAAGQQAGPVHFTDKVPPAVAQQYSDYLRSVPGVKVDFAKIGDVSLVRFVGSATCDTHHNCYVSATVPTPRGGVAEVLATKAAKVDFIGKGPYPTLLLNGVRWDFVMPLGYVADLKSAGKAFVPNLQPTGKSAAQLAAALEAGGWPAGVPFDIQVIKPGGSATPTLAVVPDMTTKGGQIACAADLCPMALMNPRHKRWLVSMMTAGTGLFAVLPQTYQQVREIGVAEQRGYVSYAWSANKHEWLNVGATYQVGSEVSK